MGQKQVRLIKSNKPASARHHSQEQPEEPDMRELCERVIRLLKQL